MERDGEATISNLIEGTVVGPSVLAGVIHGDVHFHDAAPAAAAALHPAPESWTELPVLPAEVASLLRAQVAAAQESPYRLPGARRPALAEVYVRQDLGGWAEEPRAEPSRPTPILDGHGQLLEAPTPPVTRVAVRPPVRTVREALDGDDHLVVTGGAGHGKSTLSLRLAADIAARWTSGGAEPLTEPVVPLRLSARELAVRLDIPFPEALAESARAEYGALLHAPVTAAALSDRVVGCRWLLLVDGLDEVADSDDRDRLVQVLASCASASPYRVVLTTRPIEGAAIAPLHRVGTMRYELQPFNREALHRFALNWFAEEGPDPADRFVRQIRAAHLDELVCVPLLATIAAIVFQRHADQPLPDNQYELYEAYLALLLERARTRPSPFAQHRDQLLEHLGRVRVETDTSLVAAARDWTHVTVPEHCLTAGWAEELTAFLVSTGLLVVRGEDLQFLHHSFAEHLAATAEAKDLPATFTPDAFVRLLHAARIKEAGSYARTVILHHTHLRQGEADPLLRWLRAGDAEQHLLAARLLAKRMPAGPQAVDAFLDTVRGWAMTTQYVVTDMLAQTSRATQHPGLTEWLATLMRDEAAPWESRTEAATALAVRIRQAHAREAITFLTAVVDDADKSVAVRLAAAEALSETGSSERDTAERGLRSVLRDPYASGPDLRTAAVILAAFGPDARRTAVETLLGLVDDRTIPPTVAVDAATGLIEIGVEFHARAAEMFSAVLHDKGYDAGAWENAALGMAQLGPEKTSEAAAALKSIIEDARRQFLERLVAAEALGILGPDYRITAGELLLSTISKPGTITHERQFFVSQLANFGPAFRDHAEFELRTIIRDPEATINSVHTATKALAKLSPKHSTEAAEHLLDLLAEVQLGAPVRISILGSLLDLGDPYRSSALHQLCNLMADLGEIPRNRVQAATRLSHSGPELHPKVISQLLDVIAACPDQEATLEAWDQLVRLDARFHDDAFMTLLDQARFYHTRQYPWPSPIKRFMSSDTERNQIAETMLQLAGDPTQSQRSRQNALRCVIELGSQFHPRAVAQTCELFRSASTPGFEFQYVVTIFTDVGVGLREEIARVLLELLGDFRANALRVENVISGLERLGFAHAPEVRAAVDVLARDGSATSATRLWAINMQPEVAPERLAEITFDDDVPWTKWREAVLQLAGLGADVVPRLRFLLADHDTSQQGRATAAWLVCKLRPGDRQALDELRQHAHDTHLWLTRRSDAHQALAESGTANRDAPVVYHRQIAEDERQSVSLRSWAAGKLTLLDRPSNKKTLAVLRRLAEDQENTVADRVAATAWLAFLSAVRTEPIPLLTASAARQATGGDLQTLMHQLPRKLRTEVERDLLDDHAKSIAERVPRQDRWNDLPLAAEAEAAIREVLTAPETSRRERVAAAAALADLSIHLMPEALRLLEDMANDGSYEFRARVALTKLGHAQWSRVLEEAKLVVLDDAQPVRQRLAAARLVDKVATAQPAWTAGLMRTVLADPRSSDRDRVDALFRLRRINGLGPLRKVLEDERSSSVARWRAAEKLNDFRPEDRVTAARVLAVIAADPRALPAMRWRVTRDLADYGEAGREKALELLRAMMEDTEFPVSARTDAAHVLIKIAPMTRQQALTVLYGLLTVGKPLQNRKILLTIGELEPTWAALRLMAMAQDDRLGAITRIRCADAAATLRQACREEAAVVAREIAWDEKVARHVRRRAAGHLARWSLVCRQEAREVVRALSG
ncbi:NACHT domain-containing protein [Umezawaea endophytica]|uniref:NACHT domain-containing protein n=1 Tax=Umezawaea endophytica TaxID=1654476 RepID=A0A9X2VUY6_9PSEU|nr:NACHT domain-containing protein [Umezawaea endophytica]MCS7483318.1 NACHT domain-containing protein [Umezawaea endophytica]